MNKSQTQILGIVVGSGLLFSLYNLYDQKRKDKLATQLLMALNRKLHPGTEGLLAEKAFDVHYLEELRQEVSERLLLLKPEAASGYAHQIHSAWSFWGDDENRVYGVFRNLKDKVQVSQIAQAYQANYNINLIDKLTERLSKNEIAKVLQIVDALPDYRSI